MLDSHPRVQCAGEVFLSVLRMEENMQRGADTNVRLPEDKLVRFVNAAFRSDHEEGHRGPVSARGFKIMYNQMSRYKETLLPLLLERDVVVVHLQRRDKFAIVASRLEAEAHDLWVSNKANQLEQHLRERPRKEVNINNFLDRMVHARKACWHWEHFLAQERRLRVVSVVYEELLAATPPQGPWNALLTALGVGTDPAELALAEGMHTDLVRIHADSTAVNYNRSIANFERLRREVSRRFGSHNVPRFPGEE